MRKESEYVDIGKDILGYKTDSDYVAHGQDFLAHFGTKGQRWGRRRYQNEDGSLTPEGYIHYGYALPDHEYSGPYEGRAEGRGTNAGGSGPNGGRTHYGKDDYVDVKYREVDDEPKEEKKRYENTPDRGMQEAINKAKTTPMADTKGPSDREKLATGLSATVGVVNSLTRDTQLYGPDGKKQGTVDAPLKQLAERDKRRKQANARAMNAVGIENLSNQQLQAVIDRKRLENTYLDVTTPEVQSGYEKTMQILGVVGAVAGTSLAVMQIVNQVKQMKG